jgi:hypothetical protein
MNLTQLSTADLATVVGDLADDPSQWQSQIRFGARERWWTRLRGDDIIDIWLLTWVNDTGTDLHDHGDSAGAFTVVSGELEEVRPDDRGGLIATRYGAGETCRIERGAVHDVRSPLLLPAVSIHAYSPPLREMTFYAQHDGGPQPVRTVATVSEAALA